VEKSKSELATCICSSISLGHGCG